MTVRRDHVEPLLDRYRTGELPPAEADCVRSHLEACPSCSAALRELDAFAATVERGYAAAEPRWGREPDWSRQRAKILGAIAGARGGGGWRLRAYVPQAALALIALIAVGVLVREGVRGPADAERALRSTRTAASRGPAPEADGALGTDGRQGADDLQEADAPVADAARYRRELDDLRPMERERAVTQAEALAQKEARQEVAAAPAEAGLANDTDLPAADLERYASQARAALESRDTLDARRALSLWRDTLEAGVGLENERLRAFQALADSLAVLLAARP